MSQPLTVSLPPGLDLGGGCQIIVAAVRPDTGGYVSAVDVQNVSLQVDLLRGGDLSYGPFVLVTGPQVSV